MWNNREDDFIASNGENTVKPQQLYLWNFCNLTSLIHKILYCNIALDFKALYLDDIMHQNSLYQMTYFWRVLSFSGMNKTEFWFWLKLCVDLALMTESYCMQQLTECVRWNLKFTTACIACNWNASCIVQSGPPGTAFSPGLVSCCHLQFTNRANSHKQLSICTLY